MSNPIIRHSLLPKLAACPCYVPSEREAGPAAQRGIELDAAFRLALQGDDSRMDALPDENREAVRWAVDEVRRLADGEPIETREEHLHMRTPGIEHVGTADALCVGKGWVADLKTGQMYGYFEQLAAYALACMERYFADTWTAHVLYCDLRHIESYNLTYEQAESAVRSVIDRAMSPDREPQICDYCDWCGAADRCSARVQAVAMATESVVVSEGDSITAIRDRIMSSPERMGQFLSAWRLAEKEIVEPVEQAIRERLMSDPESVPGWRVSEVSGREFFDHIAIVQAAAAGKSSLDSLVLAMGGKMPGKQFREWCESMGIAVDESLARRTEPTMRLFQKPSRTKSKKP